MEKQADNLVQCSGYFLPVKTVFSQTDGYYEIKNNLPIVFGMKVQGGVANFVQEVVHTEDGNRFRLVRMDYKNKTVHYEKF